MHRRFPIGWLLLWLMPLFVTSQFLGKEFINSHMKSCITFILHLHPVCAIAEEKFCNFQKATCFQIRSFYKFSNQISKQKKREKKKKREKG
jgi:hypothetical protein